MHFRRAVEMIFPYKFVNLLFNVLSRDGIFKKKINVKEINPTFLIDIERKVVVNVTSVLSKITIAEAFGLSNTRFSPPRVCVKICADKSGRDFLVGAANP